MQQKFYFLSSFHLSFLYIKSISSGLLKFLMIANGYVNTESTNPSNIANAPHINASIIPSIQNNSFTVNNQINPSRSSVTITPGILTKPQLNIDNVISPIKLLPNIKHD